MDHAGLSAAEIIRRAERCVGLGIRKGQPEGRIRKKGDQRSDQIRKADLIRPGEIDLIRPGEIVENNDARADTYTMTDGVSDEQFEEALAEGKAADARESCRSHSLGPGRPEGRVQA